MSKLIYRCGHSEVEACQMTEKQHTKTLCKNTALSSCRWRPRTQ